MKQKRTKEKAHRSGKSIMRCILFPMVIAMFVQAAMFSVNIIWGGTLGKLNHNAFDILNGQVVNRRNYLQNEMLGRWSNMNPAAENIGRIYEESREKNILEESDILMNSAPELISMLRRNLVTGVFFVLTQEDGSDASGEMQKSALYIRDMDPETSSANNSDLTLLYAPARISKQLEIPLDSNWSSCMSFSMSDLEDWNFYKKPYEAAIANPGVSVEDLSYWSPVFQMEEDGLDIITYSMPLQDQKGAVYAILGVEISMEYLSKQMPYQELNTEKKGMYLLGVSDGDDLNFHTQNSTGPLFKHRFGEIDELRFIEQEEYTDAYWADNTSDSKNDVYGCIQYFNLYNTNTPFENERWALIGMLGENELLGFSRGMIWSILITWGIVLILGLTAAWAASILLSHPITRLMRQLRESDPRHPLTLDKLQISEIDELSRAIETLSTRVAREASRLSQIIDMAGVEIGAFESQQGSDRVFCTDRFFEMLGLSKKLEQDGTIGREEFNDLMDTLKDQIEDQMEDGSTQILRISRMPGEEVRWVRLNVVSSSERETGVVSDITQEILKRRKIERERDYDPLTNLVNRRAFSTCLAGLFKNPPELGIAVMVMLDLDNLKFINDSYGHDCGDAYICSTADALRRYSPKQALIARMSGDEFYVLFYGYSSRKEAQEDVNALEEGVRHASFPLPDHTRLNIRASAGIAWYPEHADTYEKLLRYADFAMYQVKNTTKGEFGEFNLEEYSRNSYLLKNREEINRLIDDELVTFHFQPIVDARQGTVFGYEALMRPLLDTIKSPAEVLMLAKSQFKLYGIERLTWRKSLEIFDQFTDIEPDTRIFINSIANQRLGDKDSREIKERFGRLLPRVVVEMTEEERTTEAETRSKLEWAKGWGCEIALDDFGTGYNSDAALLAIHPSFVKLDISIVRNIDTDSNRQKLMQNLLSYTESRGIRVVAEGVETSGELHTLIGLGVDYVQGYYISKPLSCPAPIPSQIVQEIKEAYKSLSFPI